MMESQVMLTGITKSEIIWLIVVRGWFGLSEVLKKCAGTAIPYTTDPTGQKSHLHEGNCKFTPEVRGQPSCLTLTMPAVLWFLLTWV